MSSFETFLQLHKNPEPFLLEVASATGLPVNVLAVPGLPGIDELKSLGVKRISMGGFIFNKAYDVIAQLSASIQTDKNFSSIF